MLSDDYFGSYVIAKKDYATINYCIGHIKFCI